MKGVPTGTELLFLRISIYPSFALPLLRLLFSPRLSLSLLSRFSVSLLSHSVPPMLTNHPSPILSSVRAQTRAGVKGKGMQKLDLALSQRNDRGGPSNVRLIQNRCATIVRQVRPDRPRLDSVFPRGLEKFIFTRQQGRSFAFLRFIDSPRCARTVCPDARTSAFRRRELFRS